MVMSKIDKYWRAKKIFCLRFKNNDNDIFVPQSTAGRGVDIWKEYKSNLLIK